MTRRTLIQSAMPALLSAQAPSDSFRVAITGVGSRGSGLLQNLLKIPNVQIVAICDTTPEHLAAAAKAAQDKGHKPRLYTDYRKMLDEAKDVDGVVIATPVYLHMGMSIAALELGKNVYSEKPMAGTAEECSIVQKAARSAKGIYQVGFQLRHDPNHRAAIDFIHSGQLGRILFMQGQRNGGDLQRNRDWYFDRERSGDIIVEQACHILDLMTWAVGKPPLRAMGSGGINLFRNEPPGRTSMDNYTVIYEYPDDVRLTFMHIYFDPPGFSGIKERIWCSKGAVDLATASYSPLENGAKPVKLEVSGTEDSTYLSLAAFTSNSKAHKQPLNDAESARRSTLVAIMGRKAIYEKRIVNWSEVDV